MKPREHEVTISIEPRLSLRGMLGVPRGARAIVILAHGSGSSRHDAHNRRLAGLLQERELSTLLLDLLTPEEEREDRWSHRLRYDMALLGGRLIWTVSWLRHQPDLFDLPLGLFGTDTAAAAALLAAGHESGRVGAVVTRGGRIDLLGEQDLAEVAAPTLVIVGGSDVPVLAATRTTLPKLRCPKQLEVIPGAAHHFEQAGALERVGVLAGDWFNRQLGAARVATARAASSSGRGRSFGASRH